MLKLLGEMILFGVFLVFVFPVIGEGWGILSFALLMAIIRPSMTAGDAPVLDHQSKNPAKS